MFHNYTDPTLYGATLPQREIPMNVPFVPPYLTPWQVPFQGFQKFIPPFQQFAQFAQYPEFQKLAMLPYFQGYTQPHNYTQPYNIPQVTPPFMQGYNLPFYGWQRPLPF